VAVSRGGTDDVLERQRQLQHMATQRQGIDALLGQDAASAVQPPPDEELLTRIRGIAFSQNPPIENTILYYCARKVPANGTIVEIGTGHGGSAYVLAMGSEGRKVRIISVDHRSYPQAKGYLRDAPVELVVAESVAFARKWGQRKDRAIDLLFIDGGHSLADVYGDFHAWFGFVRSGGTVILHDYDEEWDGGTNHFAVRVFLDALLRAGCLVNTLHDHRCFLGVKPQDGPAGVSLDQCKAAAKSITQNIRQIASGRPMIVRTWPQTFQRLLNLFQTLRQVTAFCTVDDRQQFVAVDADQEMIERFLSGRAKQPIPCADVLTVLYVLHELLTSGDEQQAMAVAWNRNAMLHWREGIAMLKEAMGPHGFPRDTSAIDSAKDIDALSRFASLEQVRLLMLMELEQPGSYL